MRELPQVLGVDCAAHMSTLFDGEAFADESPTTLDARLDDLNRPGEGWLVCWDAPLTGPADPTVVTDHSGAYSMRPIERFLNRQGTRSPLRCGRLAAGPPEGINTGAYTQVTHWAITRALTGHPRVGPYDSERGRFPLATALDPVTRTRIAEVHPAIALWIWVSRTRPGQRFTYKKGADKRAVTADLAAELVRILVGLAGEQPDLVLAGWPADELVAAINSDDNRLDAYVAWVLGRLWLSGTGEVVQVGDATTGALLLPRDEDLLDGWAAFSSQR